ncbi:SDR family oxidoreductase [Candidatus Berkiella aquae]|uniref:Putative oxidoreductase n=1 Tax=Candidatus Berkiella aquae TaxID=295108 RepID=A0A0Q9YVC3_9GAMM|nr:SDR family oxidoreductase [Candidatus Berkiella aquae]MCS5711594.1 SDR family oxidoreductase [Candidatus Berkiella aquae]
MTASPSFKNKVVIITGASSGIGAALALCFAKEGAKLALLARRQDRLQALVNDCQALNTQAIAIGCDVTQEQDQSLAIEKIHEQLGPVDIVIANAGFGVIGNFEALNIQDYQRQFETNVYGVLRTIHATLDDLKKTKGQLVLVGSALGHITIPQYTPYSMSKHAITSLAESLYIELAPFDINVTLISPGYINTEFRNINNFGQYEENTREHAAPAALRMNAEQAAHIMLKAIRHKKRECIITLFGKTGVWLNRLFPGLLPRYFRWKFAKKIQKH